MINNFQNIFYFSLIYLVACSASPTKPIIHYASENKIAIRYSAYDTLPTLTAEAIDMAIKHCKKFDKGMKLVSSNAVSSFSSQEIHTFLCTNDFVDERIEVEVKN